MANIVMVRHGERQDYVDRDAGKNWTAGSARPFDPPLTAEGCNQGRLAGSRISALCGVLNIGQPCKVYTSPLIRCGQTSTNAAKNMGLESVSIESGLVESINEDWYRSWGAPGADSTWGGPPTCRTGRHPVKAGDLHPAALESAQSLYNTPEMMMADENVVLPIDSSHTQFWNADLHTWENRETPEGQTARLRATVIALSKKHGIGKTIVCCSHGGPCHHIYESLSQTRYESNGPCGYTAISIYQPPTDGNLDTPWKVLALNDTGHLGGKSLGVWGDDKGISSV